MRDDAGRVSGRVTDAGISVNPDRPELMERLRGAGLELCCMEQLVERAADLSTNRRADHAGRPVIVVEDRRGGALDAVLVKG